MNVLVLANIQQKVESIVIQAIKFNIKKLENNEHMKNYQIISQLGTGSFGKVELAVHEATGEKVAIKTISKKKLITKQDIQMVNKEIAVFKCVNHPNIIKLFEITEDENNLHLIMEHADKGDLLTFIKNNGTLSEATALNFLKQLAEAVEYLHLEKSIAHRDIKLANILITSKNNNIKLADFGLSNFYDKEKMQLRTCCGSPCYSAPEILIGCQYNPIVADIWSLGVVLYSMIEGCLPFYDENVKQLYKQVIKGQYCEHEKASKQLRILIRKILQINPDSRIKITQLIKEIDRLIEVKKYKMIEVPTLSHQSNDYVTQVRHQNIKKILIVKGFQENQVDQALQFRKNYSRPRKFNQLNSFIELLERKTFNKLTLLLNQLVGENKQNQIKMNTSLKRNLSTFTRDTLKNSQAMEKGGNGARFVRKGKNINLVEPEFSKQTCQKTESEMQIIKHRRKHSQLSLSLKEDTNKAGKQRSARVESIRGNQMKNGYIRISKIQENKSNVQTEVGKMMASSRPRNTNLSLSFSSRPNPKIAEYKLNLNQSINESSGKEIKNTARQETMPMHLGLFNIMHTFNGQVKNERELLDQLRLKFKNVQLNGSFNYIMKQDNKNQLYQVGIFRLQNFSSLKYVKIEPFNGQIMYQMKKILNGLERPV